MGIHGAADLRGKRVGVTAGGLPRAVLGAKPGVALSFAPHYEKGLAMLRAGELDALGADTWVGGYLISRLRIQGVALADEPFATLEGAIAVPKGRPELLAEVNRGLEILKSNGTLEDIHRKWEPKQVVFLLKEQLTSYLLYAAPRAALVLLAGMTAWTLRLRRENRARRKITGELQQFRAALDASADLVTLIDPRKMRYIDVNAAACKELGFSREELLNMSPAEVFSIAGRELGGVYDRLFAGDADAANVEGTYRRRDGSTFPVESFRRAVATAEGDIVVAIARDITRRRQ